MKCIVTGGAGFIGSHLAEQLVSFGHEVIIIDNLFSGSLENIKSFFLDILFIKADIRDLNNISTYFKGVDWVFHLAGLADIVPSIENPDDYYSTNVTGTFNVLSLSHKNNVKKIIYAASSSCYGIPSKYPTSEIDNLDPQYPYALTKLLGEQLVMHWARVYKLKAISLRLFNVFGVRSRTSGAYGAVFGVFLAQLLNSKPLTIVGNGEQSRDFTYVTDVANAFIKSAYSNVTNEIFNVGSGNHYTINYLVKLLNSNFTFINKRPGEPDCTFADISKITNLLKWEPQVKFEEGVEMMKQNINNWNSAPVWDANSIEKATSSWFKFLS